MYVCHCNKRSYYYRNPVVEQFSRWQRIDVHATSLCQSAVCVVYCMPSLHDNHSNLVTSGVLVCDTDNFGTVPNGVALKLQCSLICVHLMLLSFLIDK